MKCTVLFFSVALILLSNLVAGFDTYQSEIFVDIDKSKHNVVITFSEKPSNFEMPLFFKIESFESRANFEGSKCSIREEAWGSNIVCGFENTTANFGILGFSFNTKTEIKKANNSYLFEASDRTPFNVSKITLKILLKEGYVLSNETFQPFSPEYGKEGSDGRRIFIFWEKFNVEKGDGILAHVTFESLDIKPLNQDLTPFFILFGFIIVLMSGVFFYRTKTSGIKSAINILKDDERKVIQILEEFGGKAKQKQIQEKGDFSKATLSRLIKNLEERGLIKTERLGRNNRIYLNKNIDKKEEKVTTKETVNNEIINSEPIV